MRLQKKRLLKQNQQMEIKPSSLTTNADYHSEDECSEDESEEQSIPKAVVIPYSFFDYKYEPACISTVTETNKSRIVVRTKL